MSKQTDVVMRSYNGIQNEFADLITLLNSIPALVAYIDCNMVLQFCNQPFKTWFNINGELAGQKFPLIAGREIFDQVQRHMGKVLVGDRAHFQISVHTINGLHYLEATLSPHFDYRRRVKGFIFHCSLMESEERFRKMTSLVPLVIWTTDEKGDCNFLSSKWQQLTGKSVQEGLTKLWFNFIHPDDRDNVITSWMSCFQARKPFEGKFRFLSASGKYIVVYANASPVYVTGKEVTGYIGILQDISAEEQIKHSLEKIVLDRTEVLRKRNADLRQAETVLKEKNAELEKINNQLSSFAHIASHDLQEPLRKIQLHFDLLFDMEGDNFSAKGKDLYHRITDSANLMKNLIQDLLTYAEINDYEIKREEVDLNVILKDTINALEAKITEKNATIRIGELPVLNIVRFQFHQLFLNLLSNALKFSQPGRDPYIEVRSEVVDGYYHLTVSDNGIGFAPGQAEKIFEMFYRLHGRNKYEGTGLGLAICKKIVENHKGTIAAEGRENEGALFHIYLPVEERDK